MIGIQNAAGLLTEEEIQRVIQQGASSIEKGARILVIVPDTTRTAPMPLLFRLLVEAFRPVSSKLDFMIALGTHPPLPDAALLKHLGISEEKKSQEYADIGLFNHRWDLEDNLYHAGKISAREMATLSNGRMNQDIPVRLNRQILNYDLLLVTGPVFPHEVVGFSGGNKYFFPGIAGPEIVNATHWLGALITNLDVNGTKDTPVRAVINQAASLIPRERRCFTFVSTHDGLKGIFFDTPENAWSEAADLSAKIHIRPSHRQYPSVLGIAPRMYDDLWVAGKVMYKLESVIADGGELIIYAPHITEISVSHGDKIRQIGYHVRDYFVKQWDQFKDFPGGILAHSTHVRGIGTFENGIESPRVNVTLATGIPENVCRKINLGYLDPESINPKEWENSKNKDRLFVPNAGEVLYKYTMRNT